jgi:hypothetical protein
VVVELFVTDNDGVLVALIVRVVVGEVTVPLFAVAMFVTPPASTSAWVVT